VLGQQLPLRAVDLFTPRSDFAILVVANRAANGIDGLVSTAAGVPFARGSDHAAARRRELPPRRRGALGSAEVRAPLVIVVLNDGGGRIFEELPVATVASPEELSI
jgi:2-succinyl-5-enolpyruvyl-6-hydroxy-3-cyclohexene-1-carboxylate synthase